MAWYAKELFAQWRASGADKRWLATKPLPPLAPTIMVTIIREDGTEEVHISVMDNLMDAARVQAMKMNAQSRHQ